MGDSLLERLRSLRIASHTLLGRGLNNEEEPVVSDLSSSDDQDNSDDSENVDVYDDEFCEDKDDRIGHRSVSWDERASTIGFCDINRRAMSPAHTSQSVEGTDVSRQSLSRARALSSPALVSRETSVTRAVILLRPRSGRRRHVRQWLEMRGSVLLAQQQGDEQQRNFPARRHPQNDSSNAFHQPARSTGSHSSVSKGRTRAISAPAIRVNDGRVGRIIVPQRLPVGRRVFIKVNRRQ